MRVLVTGSRGFIGSHVVARLRARGDEVIATARAGGAGTEALDLEDFAAVGALLERTRPDAVVHLAWYAKPSDYLVSGENLASLRATVALVRCALGAGCRKIVGAGTCLEYAPSLQPVGEEHPLDPVTLYASAKASAWLTARALARAAGAELAWARIFHLFGSGEAPSRMVPSIVSALRRGEHVPVTAGEQVRDYLHVRDVASALVALLSPGASGAYNVCSGHAAPLRELLGVLAELAGGSGTLEYGARPYAPGEAMFLAGRNDRLRALGWEPAFGTVRDALADALGEGTAP